MLVATAPSSKEIWPASGRRLDCQDWALNIDRVAGLNPQAEF